MLHPDKPMDANAHDLGGYLPPPKITEDLVLSKARTCYSSLTSGYYKIPHRMNGTDHILMSDKEYP